MDAQETVAAGIPGVEEVASGSTSPEVTETTSSEAVSTEVPTPTGSPAVPEATVPSDTNSGAQVAPEATPEASEVAEPTIEQDVEEVAQEVEKEVTETPADEEVELTHEHLAQNPSLIARGFAVGQKVLKSVLGIEI